MSVATVVHAKSERAFQTDSGQSRSTFRAERRRERGEKAGAMDTPLEDVIKQEQSKRRGRGGRGRGRSARRQKQQAGGVTKRSAAALSTQIAPQVRR